MAAIRKLLDEGDRSLLDGPEAYRMAEQLGLAPSTIQKRNADIELFLELLELQEQPLPADATSMKTLTMFLALGERTDLHSWRAHAWRWWQSPPRTAENLKFYDTSKWSTRRTRAEALPSRLEGAHLGTILAHCASVEADCKKIEIKNDPTSAIPPREQSLEMLWDNLTLRQQGILAFQACLGLRVDTLSNIQEADILRPTEALVARSAVANTVLSKQDSDNLCMRIFVAVDKIRNVAERTIKVGCACKVRAYAPGNALCVLHGPGFLLKWPIDKGAAHQVNKLMNVKDHAYRVGLALAFRQACEREPEFFSGAKFDQRQGWTDKHRKAKYALNLRKFDDYPILDATRCLRWHYARGPNEAPTAWAWLDPAPVVGEKTRVITTGGFPGLGNLQSAGAGKANTAAGAKKAVFSIKEKEYAPGAKRKYNTMVVPAGLPPPATAGLPLSETDQEVEGCVCKQCVFEGAFCTCAGCLCGTCNIGCDSEHCFCDIPVYDPLPLMDENVGIGAASSTPNVTISPAQDDPFWSSNKAASSSSGFLARGLPDTRVVHGRNNAGSVTATSVSEALAALDAQTAACELAFAARRDRYTQQDRKMVDSLIEDVFGDDDDEVPLADRPMGLLPPAKRVKLASGRGKGVSGTDRSKPATSKSSVPGMRAAQVGTTAGAPRSPTTDELFRDLRSAAGLDTELQAGDPRMPDIGDQFRNTIKLDADASARALALLAPRFGSRANTDVLQKTAREHLGLDIQWALNEGVAPAAAAAAPKANIPIHAAASKASPAGPVYGVGGIPHPAGKNQQQGIFWRSEHIPASAPVRRPQQAAVANAQRAAAALLRDQQRMQDPDEGSLPEVFLRCGRDMGTKPGTWRELDVSDLYVDDGEGNRTMSQQDAKQALYRFGFCPARGWTCASKSAKPAGERWELRAECTRCPRGPAPATLKSKSTQRICKVAASGYLSKQFVADSPENQGNGSTGASVIARMKLNDAVHGDAATVGERRWPSPGYKAGAALKPKPHMDP